jgi:hypothetical protein
MSRDTWLLIASYYSIIAFLSGMILYLLVAT